MRNRIVAALLLASAFAGEASAQVTPFNAFIGALPSASSVAASDQLYVLQGGVSKRVPLSIATPAPLSGTACPSSGISPYQPFANTTSAPTGTTLNVWDGTACVPWATLNQTAHTITVMAAVQSAFGRTGNVVATTNDYNFGQIAGTLALTQIATIANNTVLGNVSGLSAAPIGLSRAQVTALINPTTTSLAGSLPALPGSSSTYFSGDGTYPTHSCASLTNAAASCATDATVANNITVGTLPDARLSNVITAGGPTGSATVAPVITYDAHGRLTAVTSATITPAASSVTGGAALTKTDDTNVTLTLGGTPASALLTGASIAAGWNGTLAAGRLNSNVVQSVVNDTNVTGSISGQSLTLGWTGTLAAARGGPGASNFAAGGSTSAYAQLGGGFIFQWGLVLVGSGATVSVTFGLTFPSAIFGCQVSIFGGATSGLSAPQFNSPTRTGVGIINNFSTSQNIEYLCYGV